MGRFIINAILGCVWNDGVAHACMLGCFSRVWLCVTLWTADLQAPLSMGVSRQGYRSGLPRLPPGDLPDPGIEPASLVSPAFASGFFTTELPGKPNAVAQKLEICLEIFTQWRSWTQSLCSTLQSMLPSGWRQGSDPPVDAASLQPSLDRPSWGGAVILSLLPPHPPTCSSWA